MRFWETAQIQVNNDGEKLFFRDENIIYLSRQSAEVTCILYFYNVILFSVAEPFWAVLHLVVPLATVVLFLVKTRRRPKALTRDVLV